MSRVSMAQDSLAKALEYLSKAGAELEEDKLASAIAAVFAARAFLGDVKTTLEDELQLRHRVERALEIEALKRQRTGGAP